MHVANVYSMTINGPSPELYGTRILENLNTVVLLFDRDLRLRYMNPAAEMLFAVSARHMVGMRAESLIHCPADLAATHLHRSQATGRPFTEREMVLPLSDNRSITVDCTVIPLTDAEGEGGMLVDCSPNQ